MKNIKAAYNKFVSADGSNFTKTELTNSNPNCVDGGTITSAYGKTWCIKCNDTTHQYCEPMLYGFGSCKPNNKFQKCRRSSRSGGSNVQFFVMYAPSKPGRIFVAPAHA